MNVTQATHATNGRPQRKQRADQLDRFDALLDGLSEGLMGAVTDAVRDGTRLAVKDAIVEILTDPALRAKLTQAAGAPRRLRGALRHRRRRRGGGSPGLALDPPRHRRAGVMMVSRSRSTMPSSRPAGPSRKRCSPCGPTMKARRATTSGRATRKPGLNVPPLLVIFPWLKERNR